MAFSIEALPVEILLVIADILLLDNLCRGPADPDLSPDPITSLSCLAHTSQHLYNTLAPILWRDVLIHQDGNYLCGGLARDIETVPDIETMPGISEKCLQHVIICEMQMFRLLMGPKKIKWSLELVHPNFMPNLQDLTLILEKTTNIKATYSYLGSGLKAYTHPIKLYIPEARTDEHILQLEKTGLLGRLASLQFEALDFISREELDRDFKQMTTLEMVTWILPDERLLASSQHFPCLKTIYIIPFGLLPAPTNLNWLPSCVEKLICPLELFNAINRGDHGTHGLLELNVLDQVNYSPTSLCRLPFTKLQLFSLSSTGRKWDPLLRNIVREVLENNPRLIKLTLDFLHHEDYEGVISRLPLGLNEITIFKLDKSYQQFFFHLFKNETRALPMLEWLHVRLSETIAFDANCLDPIYETGLPLKVLVGSRSALEPLPVVLDESHENTAVTWKDPGFMNLEDLLQKFSQYKNFRCLLFEGKNLDRNKSGVKLWDAGFKELKLS